MRIDLEYKDGSGNITNPTMQISRLAFAKHLAFAGQGYAPKLNKIQKVIGLFFVFRNYISRDDFYNQNRFSQPSIRFSDPTEKAQFSNLAGKALADYYSKKINNSILTVNYEAAMRLRNHPIIGSRPDLIAFNSSNTFAIECKGYSKSSSGRMAKHKRQSQAGPIPVNFTIASVNYNLYNRTKSKYHDPVNPEAQYDEDLLRNLSIQYYAGIKEYFDERYFERNEIEVNGEQFYEIEIFTSSFIRSLGFERFPWIMHEIEYLMFRRAGLKLIIPQNISELAESGINSIIEPFYIGESETNYLYIDNDRIGLKLRNGS